MPQPRLLRVLRVCLLAVSVSALVGCRASNKEEPVVVSAAAQRELEAQRAAATPPPAAPAQAPAINPAIPESNRVPSAHPAGYPKEGWSKVVVQDEVPLCVFPGHVERDAAPFIEQAKPQKLPANTKIVFGAYAPHCINEHCDDIPSLQCWVDREGDTLTVRSRYVAYHKDESSCGEPCRQVTAGCPTPELPAGKYKVKYGEHTFDLKIPSTPKSACFALK